jgi:hypothetical protein
VTEVVSVAVTTVDAVPVTDSVVLTVSDRVRVVTVVRLIDSVVETVSVARRTAAS